MVMKQVKEIKQSTTDQLNGIGKQIEEYQSEIEKYKTERITMLKDGNGAKAIEIQRSIDALQQFIDAFDSDIDKVMIERSSIDALIEKEIIKYLKERTGLLNMYKEKAEELKPIHQKLVDGLEEMYGHYERINHINNYLEYISNEMSNEATGDLNKIDLVGYTPANTMPLFRELLIPSVKGVRK
ncbi:hypothetical protein [Psychrobacillus antarcticus]|uniref:hypothetical protein n=1 Tax=Psychrobacillus antarcticus TaxID=2879115 RepID=UPI002407C4C9|nr:hypothetical protein [Psychrobacillus antarcticus]